LLFPLLPPRLLIAMPLSQAMGHLVQPTGHGIVADNRSGLAGQDKKRGLKSILGILQARQDPPAHSKHKTTVPPHQASEGRFVLSLHIAVQQLAIAQLFESLGVNEVTEMVENGLKGRRHGNSPAKMALYLIESAEE
jgi:hypothetical protein